jgi:hypothetical protein
MSYARCQDQLRKTRLLPVIAILLATPALAQNWELKKTFPEAGIRVWYREHADNSRLVEYRGEIILDSHIEDIVRIITDVPHFSDWVYQLENAEVVQEVDADTDYIHMIMTSPVFFLEDRDSYLLSRLVRFADSSEIQMIGTVVPDYGPEEADYTRIKSGRTLWTLQPSGENRVKVVFEGYGDPGGIISALGITFIMKNLLWRLPYETLLGLQEQLAERR